MTASATTEVDLANMALIMLGQQPISALADDNNRANLVDARLADVRDTVLRSHQWNCATMRASLSADATTPTWGYKYRFALPADFIKLVKTENNTTDYRIEAGNQTETPTGTDPILFILTDEAELNITYVYQITNVAMMDVTLKQAIATRLAADIAIAVSGEVALEGAMMAKYQLTLAEAKYEDSTAHSDLETLRGGEWLDARLGGGTSRDFPPLDGGGAPT